MDRQTLIRKLNEDLAQEYTGIIQYTTYAAKATGPYRPQLAQFLANKIVALGGDPTMKADPVQPAETDKKMIEAVMAAERTAIKNYTRRIKDAEDFGDKGLAVQLENMVQEESNHAEETERILRNWPDGG